MTTSTTTTSVSTTSSKKSNRRPPGHSRTRTRVQAVFALLAIGLTLLTVVAPASAGRRGRRSHNPPAPPAAEPAAPAESGLPVLITNDPVQMEVTIANGVATLDFSWDPIPGPYTGPFFIMKAGSVVATVSGTSYSRSSNWWFNLVGPYDVCGTTCWSFTVEPPPGKTSYDFV